MTEREILDAIIKSGRKFSVSEYDGMTTISVFDDEEESACCGCCSGEDNHLYIRSSEPEIKNYAFTLFTLPFGSENKFKKYSTLKKKPTIGDYAVSFCAHMASISNDEKEVCEEIYQALNEDDELWFAPSTSDVIELSLDGEHNFYYIDSEGFRKIPNFTSFDNK